MTITVFLFDYGGVLQTPLDAEAVAARRERLARRLGFSDSKAMWLYFYGGDVWQETKTGLMTDAEMWTVLLKPLGLVTRDQQAEFVAELFRGEGLHPEMRQLLEQLRPHYKLGILSNASDILESLIRHRLGLANCFDVIVNSHRIGVAKPDERAYLTALERLGVEPQEVFFVDDQMRNIVAAQELGLNGHLFVDVPTLRADLARRSLLEA